MRILGTSTIIVFLAAIVGWLSYTFWHAYKPKPIRIQGQIEAQQYNISSKLPGRIDQVFVRKGDQVTTGQPIFTLYSPEIRGGFVAEQQRDEAKTKMEAARYTCNAALQMYTMAEEGARAETKKAAEGKARMAAGAVAEVEVYVADTKIASYHDGEVAQVLLHSGELAPHGFPVVTIIGMKDAYAIFHVREDLLADFRKGSEFDATIPAIGGTSHRFRVSHVAVMGDFATWRATNGDKGFDMRSFEIEARPAQPIDGLRVGMSVLVTQK